MIKVFAFCEIGKEIGAGHLKRSLKFLNRTHFSKSLEKNATLFILDRDKELDLDVSFSNHKVFHSINELTNFIPENSFVFVDGYILSNEIKKNLKFKSNIICEFVDSPSQNLEYIDIGIVKEFKPIKSRINDFAIINMRNKYFINRTNIEFKKETRQILVCIGGSDPLDISPKILDILKIKKKYKIIYATLDTDTGKKLIKKYGTSINFVIGKNIDELLLKSNFVITNAGVTGTEALTSGCNTLSLVLAENQIETSREISKKGGLILEIDKIFDHFELEKKIDNLLNMKNLKSNQFQDFGEELMISIDRIIKTRFRKGRIKTSAYKKKNIIEEYNQHALETNEFEKNRWGSKFSMGVRYEILEKLLNKNRPGIWLDIGCGTGLLQKRIQKSIPNAKGIGIDINLNSLKIAKAKKLENFSFFEVDIMNKEETSILNKKQFDYISCIGVLSKSNLTIDKLIKFANKNLSHDGKLCFDIQNENWELINNGFLPKETRHLWFNIKEILLYLDKLNWSINYWVGLKYKNYNYELFQNKDDNLLKTNSDYYCIYLEIKKS